tara:strand:- start:7877 stop:9538 length:1662 start_codon:yes stop_codon:yes gene_type:complete
MFPYKYDFSIVMGYYNRKHQTIRTLDKFEETYKAYNYEVVIVDDNSKPEHFLDEDLKKYTFKYKYIKITPEEKGRRLNPCSVYNKGFKNAEGKIVIIQNPECIHVGDLLQYLKNNLKYHNYLAFSAYNCTSEDHTVRLLSNIELVNSKEFSSQNQVCWYNHPTVRPSHYHFCAAMMNDNLKLLGGFDEEFAKGAWYDDNEILLSIAVNLKIKIETLSPDVGFVVHQWHSRDAESTFTQQEYDALIARNKSLYESYLKYHQENPFDYPKLLHLYWDKSNFSYLNLLTVLSFNKYHTAWKINVFCPKTPVTEKSWKGDEQKVDYVGKDYFEELKKITNVNIHEVDFNKLPFKHKDASEVIKSDFFRLYILNKYGGLWSDFDVIYTNNVEKYHNARIKDKSMVIYRYPIPNTPNNVYPIGMFLAKKNNSILTTILVNIHRFYNPDNYQCLGASMFQFIFNKDFYAQSKEFLTKMKIPELFMADAGCYLPYKWNELDFLFKNKGNSAYELEKRDNVFGVHWFNGAAAAKNYCNELDIEKLKSSNPNCLIDELVKKYI